jgi:hypothetical protein
MSGSGTRNGSQQHVKKYYFQPKEMTQTTSADFFLSAERTAGLVAYQQNYSLHLRFAPPESLPQEFFATGSITVSFSYLLSQTPRKLGPYNH